MSTNAAQQICPRCGYDQSGIIATWEHSCPMEGVCSECGLNLRWEEILSPKFAAPAWSFEHAPHLSPSRFFQTHARATAPWLFWRKLRLAHPVVVRRLIIGVIVWVVLCHTLVSVVTGVRIYLRGSGAIARLPLTFLGPGGPPTTITPRPTPKSARRQVFAPAPGFGPAPTIQQARAAMWETVIAGTLWPYNLERLWWGRFAGVRYQSVVTHWLGELLIFALMIPPGFLVLGETFRRCKVRFVHLIRGTAYSLSVPAIGTAACVLSAAAFDTAPWGALYLICVPWLCVYWVVFTRVYLRLTHAGWVAAVMLTIAGLVALIGGVLGWITRMNAW